MTEILREVGSGVLTAVMPLAAIFVIFQATLLRLPRALAGNILVGTLLASMGLFLFLVGVELAFLPFGRAIGEALGALPARWPLVVIGVLLGFVTTWGEPSVRILANQVEAASSGSLRASVVVTAVALGVAIWVGLGMARVVFGLPLILLVVPGYLVVLAMIAFSDPAFVSIAIDAGGVATGPLANTFLLAFALGASAASGSANPVVDGLGLVALIALAPIISVMALGYALRRRRGKE